MSELHFIDTMMTTIVFYGFDRRIPVAEAKSMIDKICIQLDEIPSHAHIGFSEGKKTRAPKFSMLSNAITRGEFENYKYIEAANYFAKGNVRDLSLQVGVIE